MMSDMRHAPCIVLSIVMFVFCLVWLDVKIMCEVLAHDASVKRDGFVRLR